MARPHKNPLTPEQAERRDRLENALRHASLTWTQFCAQHGFSLETLWRWVSNGEPRFAPRNGGKPTSSLTMAEALGIDPGYLRSNGPRLWAKPMPYRSDALSEQPEPEAPPGRYTVRWAGPDGQGAGGCREKRASLALALQAIMRPGAVGIRARVLKGETIIAEWIKLDDGKIKRVV